MLLTCSAWEVSTNAANAFNASVRALSPSTTIIAWRATIIRCSSWSKARSSVLTSWRHLCINMRLRDDYTRDCAKGIEVPTKSSERTGVRS